MTQISNELDLFIKLAKAKTKVSRRFDNRLSFRGLGFSDFAIMLALSQSSEEKMRRIDLAEAIGLTASGVTRLLLPMEKIGLITREESVHDGRVSYVKLSSAGRRLLDESLEDAEVLAKEILSFSKASKIDEIAVVLDGMGKVVVY